MLHVAHAKTRSVPAISDSHLFYCYYSVRESKNLFQGLSATAGIGGISQRRQRTGTDVYPSCETTLTAVEGRLSLSYLKPENEVVRYIRLKRSNSAPYFIV